MKVVFVCTGNTCRSPMAEALLRRIVENWKIAGVEVSSAGLMAYPGDPAAENAVRIAAEFGADLSCHRSRAVTPWLVQEADLLVGMTSEHIRALSGMTSPDKLCLLGEEIPDPFGGDLCAYRRCAARILSAMQGLLILIRSIQARQAAVVLMCAEHIEQIEQIEQMCFSQPWSADALRTELTKPDAVFLTANCGGVTAGYIGVHVVLDEGYMANLAVHPAFRRDGLGQKLLDAAHEASRARGAAFLTLEVRASNRAARRLYEKNGYRPVGIRKNFYAKPREDAILLTKYFSGEPE